MEVPAGPSTTLRTGYGYDAAGNLTRVTDGNGHTTVYDYQAWGLLEEVVEVVEPSTPQHPDPSERTWTTRYDLGGLPDRDLLPGGVSVRRDFDELGRLTSETGCRREGGSDCVTQPGNPDAPEATREFAWDRAGRRVRVSDPRHPVLMVYDDRDLLVQATTQAHSTRFGYDADGRMTSRDDNAGTSTFTWTQADELSSATDPLTGQRRDYRWDEAGQLSQMDTPGGAERDWFYDGLGRVEQEILRGPAGQDSRFVYDYDPDGNPVRQQVSFDGDVGAAANSGEGLHRYCYDAAGRLTRWDRRPADPDAPADCAPVDPAAADAAEVTDYRWDGAGNRVAAGGETFAYDQRNRMVSGPDGAYRYTARGTLAEVTGDEAGDGDSTASVLDALGLQAQAGALAEVTGGGGSTVSVFDALGRQVQSGPVALAYDSLDRLVTRQSPAGTTGFEYAGTEIDPVTSTGELAAAYARSPAGRLLAQTEQGGPALLAGLGRHGDLTQLHTADGALAGSKVYDPFGKPVGTAGATSRLGFQADWTDPDSGQVWMGARWYDPANAQFTSRDTVMGELTTPIALNRYTYASNNPLAYYDPDGRRVSAVTNGAPSMSTTWRGGSCPPAASRATCCWPRPATATTRRATRPAAPRRAGSPMLFRGLMITSRASSSETRVPTPDPGQSEDPMSPLETAIRVIVELLVRREYDAIARLTHCRRLSASDLQHAVLSYGRKLARPPDGWIDLVDVVPIDDREQAAFFAAVPLWTEEEGRSDLTLELRLSEFAPQLYDTEVLDVHVL